MRVCAVIGDHLQSSLHHSLQVALRFRARKCLKKVHIEQTWGTSLVSWDLLSDHIIIHMQVYNAAAKPVEDFFQGQGTLLDFDIYGGIPETMPRLLSAVGPFQTAVGRSSQQRATVG